MASSTSTSDTTAAAPPRGAAAASARAHRTIALVGAGIGLLSSTVLPFVSFRPNRVVEGVQSTTLEAFGVGGWIVVGMWLLAGALALARPTRLVTLLRGLSVAAIVTTVLLSTGDAAQAFASGQGTIARTSYVGGFYLMLVALFLTWYSASQSMHSARDRWLAFAATVVSVVAVTASGQIAELGIVREFQLTDDVFGREVRRHLFLALGSTAAAAAIGIPAGIWAARNRTIEAPVMGTLSLGQVFPALAFIGLMMPVLGGLADRFPFLRELGISGIGWAPVFIVLVVYALFPITRNTLVAIRQVDPQIVDAAVGMGMGRWHTLIEVELPIAFPVVLAGIRVALVQNTAGTILAALVGGGGLGAIMFFGLEQVSMDLVLVGVVPIVALALVFDATLRGLERAVGGAGEDFA